MSVFRDRNLKKQQGGTGMKMSANVCAKFSSGKILVFAKRVEFTQHLRKLSFFDVILKNNF
jgi:hypothetical protein